MKKRIFIFSLIITIIGILAFLVISTNVYYDNSIQYEKNNLNIYMNFYDADVYGFDNEGAIAFSNKIDNARVTFLKFDGTVIADSEVESSTLENHLNRKEIQEALKNGDGYSIRSSSSIKKNMLYYCVKDSTNERLIRIGVPTSSIFAIYLNALPTTIWFLLLDVFFCGILSLFIIDFILKPVEHLASDCSLNKPVSSKYKELEPIAEIMNNYNLEIEEKIQKIQDDQKMENIILNNMEHGIAILDDNQKIILINNAARNLMNVLEDENKIYYFLTDNDSIEIFNKKENSILYRTIKSKEYAIRFTFLEESCVILITDVTEIRRSEKSKNDFIANVTHEMNTPLTSIKGFAELITQGMLDEKKTKHAGEVIINQANRLSLLVKNIINYSSYEADDLPSYSINISEIINSVTASLEGAAKEKNIKLVADIQNNIYILSREERILEIALNLISNAIKYNKENGVVNINLYEQNKNVFFEVIDTGIGISKDNYDKIFDRFYTVDKSHNKSSSGFGLGLAIVKKICLIEKYTIKVESKIGEGSKFLVLIPQKEQ